MTGGENISVDVQFACNHPASPIVDDVERWVRTACHAVEYPGEAQTEIAVRIVDEAEMEVLNRDYRHKDGPTNVLSFPGGEPQALPGELPRQLGDIVVCAPIVAAEAVQQGKDVLDHWAHMLVHGTLHLLGYDHLRDADAEKMEGLEIEILSGNGVRDPYSGIR